MRTLTIAAVLLAAATAVSAQTRSVYIEDLTWFEIRDAQAAGKTAARAAALVGSDRWLLAQENRRGVSLE